MANEIITLGVSEIHCRQGGIHKIHKFVVHKLVNLILFNLYSSEMLYLIFQNPLGKKFCVISLFALCAAK